MQNTQTTHHDQAHPPERLYVKVALWLGVITGVEIALSYIKMPDWLLILGLVVLAVIKFVAVVGYFMHLKFDNKALRKPFITGIVTALLIYSVVLASLILHDTNVPATG